MDVQKAKDRLSEGNYTCVLCKENQIFTSSHRGVKPLLDFFYSNNDFSSFSAADKVVGKATAFLYCLLGIKALYAQVLSIPAKEVLMDWGIQFSYGTLVPGIRNRENSGPCPMEQATRECHTPEQALIAIEKTLETLQSNGH